VTLDFSSQIHYLWALLPEVVLAGTGLLVLTLDVFQRGDRSGPSGAWVRWTAVAGVLLALVANGYLLGFDAPMRSGMIAMDAFRVATNFVILGATVLSFLFAFDYLRREGLDVGEFYFLMLMAAVGMMLLAGSRDLIVVFVSVELMSLAVYVLTGFSRRDPRSAEGALKYFLMGAFASGFLLYGIALLFGATGSTNLALVTSEVARGTADGNLLLIAGVALVVVGFAFKISAVPFHMWTPDVYEGAPTPVTGFMAAGVKAAGFAALLRIVTVELAPAASIWSIILWWLAVLTMVVPNLIALAQDNVKRMLAYSSIAHAGYLLVGVVVGSASGRSAALLYLAVYAVMTLGAFAVVGAVAGGSDSRGGLADFRGLGWRRPLLGGLFVVFLLSLAGFPPTGGFIGKLYLLLAAVEAGQVTLAVVLVLTSFVSYYYYLRVIWKMYFEEAPEGAPLPAAPGAAFRLAAVVSAVVILVAGLVPGRAIRAAEYAGQDLAPRQVAPLSQPAAPVGVTETRTD
jgi:NADH-quinone oxidoreductase subunit N